jgi:hypothetical protein
MNMKTNDKESGCLCDVCLCSAEKNCGCKTQSKR